MDHIVLRYESNKKYILQKGDKIEKNYFYIFDNNDNIYNNI